MRGMTGRSHYSQGLDGGEGGEKHRVGQGQARRNQDLHVASKGTGVICPLFPSHSIPPSTGAEGRSLEKYQAEDPFLPVANTLSASTWKSHIPSLVDSGLQPCTPCTPQGKPCSGPNSPALRWGSSPQYRDQGGTDGEDDSNHY